MAMIDDDDVTQLILAWPVFGPVSLVLGIVVVAIVWHVACDNEAECEAKSCPRGGHAKLLDGECVCAERPVP